MASINIWASVLKHFEKKSIIVFPTNIWDNIKRVLKDAVVYKTLDDLPAYLGQAFDVALPMLDAT